MLLLYPEFSRNATAGNSGKLFTILENPITDANTACTGAAKTTHPHPTARGFMRCYTGGSL